MQAEDTILVVIMGNTLCSGFLLHVHVWVVENLDGKS